jgi:hypothetical protein
MRQPQDGLHFGSTYQIIRIDLFTHVIQSREVDSLLLERCGAKLEVAAPVLEGALLSDTQLRLYTNLVACKCNRAGKRLSRRRRSLTDQGLSLTRP